MEFPSTVAFSPNGSNFLTSSGTTTLGDVETGKELRTFSPASGPVAFSPDGKEVLIGITLWDAVAGTIMGTGMGHTDVITSVPFSRDGKKDRTGSLDGAAEWSLHLK
ncbi:MAG: WD40 repeat domain-containing protein [bacterium]